VNFLPARILNFVLYVINIPLLSLKATGIARNLNPDKTLSLSDFFVAHSSISLDGNLGTSLTYQVNKTIGVRSFIDCDYVFRKPILDFKDTAAYSPSANKPIRRYTFGVAMNILF